MLIKGRFEEPVQDFERGDLGTGGVSLGENFMHVHTIGRGQWHNCIICNVQFDIIN